MFKIKRKISILLAFTLIFTTIVSTPSVSYAGSSPKYWLKVNAQANVVNVYKKNGKRWEPYRAMLCSTGTGKDGSYEATPPGTYYISSRWDWGAMVGGVYARYVVQFYGDFLFHSVPYEEAYDKASQPTKEYNKLGKDASHGCVRLSIMDAKWVYENCRRGTKVTVYNSKDPGPLGKPAGIKVNTSRKEFWDPSDPDKDNPYYKLPKPVITINENKRTVIQFGSHYKLKNGVTAIDPNTFQDLTSLVKIHRVQRYSTAKKKYVDATFSTKKLGIYRVTYRVKYKYGGTATKVFSVHVVDNLKAPVFSGAQDHNVSVGESNAVAGVSAKQASCDRTSAIKVYIKKPGSNKYHYMTYTEAEGYTFDTPGLYLVKYIVANKHDTYIKSTKQIIITCK